MITTTRRAYSVADLDDWAVVATRPPLGDGRAWVGSWDWFADEGECALIKDLRHQDRVITVQRREEDGSYSLLAKSASNFAEPEVTTKHIVRRARVA